MSSHWGLSDLQIIAKQDGMIIALTSRVEMLTAALRRFVEWEAADLTDAERAYGLVAVAEQAHSALKSTGEPK